MTPLAPPPSCPRLREGGDGPRLCGATWCRYHLLELSARGDVRAWGGDTCSRDVEARGGLSRAELARRSGLSVEGLRRLEVRALVVLRRRLTGGA